MTPDRRTLLALFAIAFGLRIAYAALIGTSPEINPTPISFDFRVAERIHDNLAWVSQPFTPMAPGYVLTLAVIFRLFGASLWTVIVFQAFLGGVVAVFLYRIGEQRLGRGVGLLSAIWYGISVHQIHYASLASRDTLVVFAFNWFLFTVVTRFQKMRQSVLAGLAFTFLVHVDPMFMLLFPVIVVVLWFKATQHRILNVQYTFLFISAIFILSLPWTLRNYVVYHEFVPTSIEGSRYTEPLRRLIGMGNDEAPPPENAWRPGIRHNSVEFWRVTRFADTPADESRGVAAQPAWSTRHNVINILSFGILLPFCVYGVVLAIRKRKRAALFLVGAVLCFFLLRAYYGGGERMRLPVEPMIILLAFYGLTQFIARVRGVTRAPEATAAS